MRTGEFVERHPEAWQSAAPGYPDYREFVEHWTVTEFATLNEASAKEREEAELVFLDGIRLERDFWEMAYGGGEG